MDTRLVTPESRTVVAHDHPIWRDRADFLIQVDLAPWGLAGGPEQLWARRVAVDRFEICCVPYFPYGIRLGDVVQTAAGAPWWYERVVIPGDRLNLRFVVAREESLETLDHIVCGVLEDGRCAYERWQRGYVAADVPSPQSEMVVMAALRPYLTTGDLCVESV
jgi:hypothetical protein